MEKVTGTSPRRTPLDLVGEVAESRVAGAIAEVGGARAVFGIVDLGPELTTAIGNALVTSPLENVEVAIHPDLVTEDLIDEEMISSDVATRFRNKAKEGVAATVFSVPPGEFEGVYQSLGSVTRIDETWLFAPDKTKAWVSKTLPGHPSQTTELLGQILQGLIDSDILASARMMADFCAEIRTAMSDSGLTLVEAVNRALPYLRLPRDFFGDVNPKTFASQATRRFRDARERFQRDFYLVSRKGEWIPRREMLAKISELCDEDRLEDDAAEALRNLVNDVEITAGSWRSSQQRVSECSWQKVASFFGNKVIRQHEGLGERTITYLNAEWPRRLKPGETELLETVKRESDSANPDHSEFFNRYRELLQEDAKLFKRWRRFIFDKAVEETDDLVTGLVELAGKAFDQAQEIDDPILLVILRNSEKKSFWTKQKNTGLCTYLRDRYRGLDKLLEPVAVLDFGRCWTEDWASEVDKANTRGTSSEVFEFEAYVVAKEDLSAARENPKILGKSNKAQLNWKPDRRTFATAMSEDLGRIIKDSDQAYLLRAKVAAARSTRGGAMERPTVSAVTSITDSLGGSDGSLANPDEDNESKGWNRIDRFWMEKLDEHSKKHLLTEEQHIELLRAFEGFCSAYTQAIKDLITIGGRGLASEALLAQANRYGTLLGMLRKRARATTLIRDLWEPLLQIGTAIVDGDMPRMIVAPWHPLRLLDLAAKAHQAKEVIAAIASGPSGQLATLDDFVREKLRSMRQSYYANVNFIRVEDSVSVLIESESRSGYSLLQSSNFGADNHLADQPAEEAVEKFSEIASQYLAQMPHERANFSAVLLDAESEELPVEISKNLARQIEDQADLRCDLTVTHEDPRKLRQIYERQNRRIGYEIDSSLTSEAARNFLSRLRVGISALESLSSNGSTRRQDIVMLHDVIARAAKTVWHQVPSSGVEEQILSHVPTNVSRRKSQSKGDLKTSVYLTSPSQVSPSQAFLNAVHDAMHDRASNGLPHFIPAQEVDTRSHVIVDKLTTAHQMAHWVITYDKIADRRLIAETSSDLRILRYFSSPRSIHNVIVSTELSRKSLRSRLQRDIEGLVPDLGDDALDELVDAIHKRSAKLSGEIVMRSAHWDNYSQELVGIVIAQREIELLLGQKRDNCTAMFFLDEFRGWLNLTGEISDILAVDLCASPKGKPQIRLLVSEAKFVNQAGFSESRSKSWSQMENTYREVVKRFSSSAVSIGTNIWRNRLADMLVEHMDPWPEQEVLCGMTFDQWISGIRSGIGIGIEVSGHSIVCVHDLFESSNDPDLRVADEEYVGTERRRLAQWTLGAGLIRKSIEGVGGPESTPIVKEPKEWSNAPSFVIEGSKGTRKFGASITDTCEVTEETRQNDALDKSSDEATRYPKRSTDSGRDASSNIAIPSDTQSESIDTERKLDVAREDGPIDKVPQGWNAEVFAALNGMLRKEEGIEGQAWLEEQVGKLQQSIQAENKAAPVIDARLTPNSGLVYLNARDVTVGWLERNRIDLLTRYGVEILRVTGLPGQIAVALKRPKRGVLHLSDAWRRRKLESSAPNKNLALVVGEKEDDGELLYLSLEREFEEFERAAPHTIISGTTGSGKGILVSNLILDICAFNDPHAVRIHLIDPKKGADYLWAGELPHLQGGIVHEKPAAIERLTRIVNDMERRYLRITEAGFSNVDQYNLNQPPEAIIPRDIIFFDEVANWMLDNEFKKEVDSLIDQVATKSRAAGLHLFLIYQRADNKVMTMQLRTNLGNKLILRLGDEGSSRIALGEKGAERLLGKGHVIAKLDSDRKIHAQVPFIEMGEARSLAKTIAEAWGYSQPKRPIPKGGKL